MTTTSTIKPFDEYLEPLNQCFNDNIGKMCHEIQPYSNVYVNYGTNPATGRKYNDEGNAESFKQKFKKKCNIKGGNYSKCCDENNELLYGKAKGETEWEFYKDIKVKETRDSNGNIKSLTNCDGMSADCKQIEPHHLCLLGNNKDKIQGAGVKVSVVNDTCSRNVCPEAFYHVADVFSNVVSKYDDYNLVKIIHDDDLDAFKELFMNNGTQDYKLLTTKLLTGYPGNCPLHEAISYNSQKITLFIVKHATTNDILNDQNTDGNTPLHLCNLLGEHVLSHMLIKYGADTSLTNAIGDTPLHSATRSGDYDVVAVLLNIGADVNAENKMKETPLHSAVMAKKKNLKSIQDLIRYGSDVLHLNRNNMTVCEVLDKFKKTKKNEEIRTFLQNAVIERIRNAGLPISENFQSSSEITTSISINYDPFMTNYRKWIQAHPKDAFFDIINPTNKEVFDLSKQKANKTVNGKDCGGTDCPDIIEYIQDVSIPTNLEHKLDDRELYRSPVQNNIKDMKDMYEDILKKEHNVEDHVHDEDEDEDESFTNVQESEELSNTEHFTNNNIETFDNFNRRFKSPRSNCAIMIYVITIVFFILIVFVISLKYN
tara:strand:+ start:17652 stop:19445 length:1794 start_codon:yes stop_codon:yes gene_type:complete